MRYRPIEWRDSRLRILDQTRLPLEVEYIHCRDVTEVADAIRNLKVRGAPAIGIAAAFGMVQGMYGTTERDDPREAFHRFRKELASTRPTAVNLFWALDRLSAVFEETRLGPFHLMRSALEKEAIRILEEDLAVCREIGKNGFALLDEGTRILTHCNAGGLATGGYGTALAPVYRAKEQGVTVHVYADETRPLLQGARLTAWELTEAGIGVTLLCDGMAARLMREGEIDLVIVGADRIASNGDVANKIGTYGLAVAAHHHGIPFYVAAPLSTVDMKLRSGEEIPIEFRDAAEVTVINGIRIAPEGVDVYSPAFDMTPAALVRGIITEKGVASPATDIARMLHRAKI